MGGREAFERAGMPQGGDYKFADRVLPWETFISPDDRSAGIWREAGERLRGDG